MQREEKPVTATGVIDQTVIQSKESLKAWSEPKTRRAPIRITLRAEMT
ncbi:MAG: hypothetical protein ACYDDO_10830 [Acidiferrobacterales bacterium]